jgi:hypothetical protein
MGTATEAGADAATDTQLGLVQITVNGCPRPGPAAALATPTVAAVRQHDWAVAGAAAPGAVLPMELTVQQVGGGRVVGRGGSRGAVLRRGWAAGVDRAGGWAA